MFTRNDKGNLRFEKLDFEILISDFLEEGNPKNMDDLRWMVSKMTDTVQLMGWEYCQCHDKIGEWEDTHHPAEY